MKKRLIAIAIILVIVIVTLCTLSVFLYLGRYKDWQEIDVPEVGTFKIPPDWAYHREDNRIYLTDKNIDAPTQENIYIAGTVQVPGYNEAACQIFDSNAKYVDTISGRIFSNSAYIGKAEYVIHEKPCTKVILDLWAPYDTEVDMLVWDDSVDYKLTEKIAKSYAMHLNEDK